jgi:uncharacterized protein YecE (DUF72 family)
LWAERTPEGFVFDVKAYALLTGHGTRFDRLPTALRGLVTAPADGHKNIYLRHLPDEGVELIWRIHRQALEPLREAGKLGAVLFQFPPWFTRTTENIDYVRSLRRRLPDYRLAVEFRGGGWMEEEAVAGTLALLEHEELAYVSVDEPQGFRSSTPPVAAATTELGYVRLHGRNRDTWDARSAVASDRFNYLYSDDELREWLPRVRELAQTARAVHVLFNNNYEDYGLRNARQMAALLTE